MTLSITIAFECQCDESHYAECRLFIVRQNVIMLSVVMLSVVAPMTVQKIIE